MSYCIQLSVVAHSKATEIIEYHHNSSLGGFEVAGQNSQ
jgi:hypothetical protein